MYTPSFTTCHRVAAVLAVLAANAAIALPGHAAAVTLDPLATGSAPGTGMAGGLAGTWYQIDGSQRFSNLAYTETDPDSPVAGQALRIKDFAWGTGLWSTGDIATAIADPSLVKATAQTVGAISYANNIYNNTVLSGSYGTWGEDFARTLNPFSGPANGCGVATQFTVGCAGELHYAAIFSGYLYIATAGSYDFGVFADDGFEFLLTGSNDALGMGLPSVVGSSGRAHYTLQDANNLSALNLAQGYYGISLNYFNREEAGVVELGWTGPGAASTWTTIGSDVLVPTNAVPEPGTVWMLLLGMLALGHTTARRRRTHPAPA